MMFNNVYTGKKVLVTGHTGFKGAWLTSWLSLLGAKVMGISDDIPSSPSLFELLRLEDTIDHRLLDIRQADPLSKAIHEFMPDFVFHLAAQAIVSTSYADPLGTISTNVIGTANILDAIRQLSSPCTAVIITSDKCYENVEWEWGYRETDQLGGKDIYSASKGAAEIIFNGYYHSFFKGHPEIRIASARAGNVIGGGDWAKDRIIVDAVLSWSESKSAQLRSPGATRPWQHVLEPLSGYLWLGANLHLNKNLSGESFNFGPRAEQNRSVVELISDLFEYWQQEFDCYQVTNRIPFHEAGLLKLNCDKALFHLKWAATLDYSECVQMVGEWYAGYYLKKQDIREITTNQIQAYSDFARSRNIVWSN